MLMMNVTREYVNVHTFKETNYLRKYREYIKENILFNKYIVFN